MKWSSFTDEDPISKCCNSMPLILITGYCNRSLHLSSYIHFIKCKLIPHKNTINLRNDNLYFNYPTLKTTVSLVVILSLTSILIVSVLVSSSHVADAQKGKGIKSPSISRPGGPREPLAQRTPTLGEPKIGEPKIGEPKIGEPKIDIQTKNSIIKEKIKNMKISLKPSTETESVFRASNERIFRSLIDFVGIVSNFVPGINTDSTMNDKVIIIHKNKSKTDFISAFVFTFLLSATLLFVFEQAIAQNITNFSTYQNPVHGIKMDYPSSWIIKENISSENVVAIRDPSPNDRSLIAVSISVQNLQSILNRPNISPSDYNSLQLNYLLNKSEARDIGEITNIDEKFNLSNNEAYKAEYSFSGFLSPSKSSFIPIIGNTTQMWTVKDDKAYIITAMFSPPNIKESVLPILNRMVSSFEIIK